MIPSKVTEPESQAEVTERGSSALKLEVSSRQEASSRLEDLTSTEVNIKTSSYDGQITDVSQTTSN